MPNPSPSEAIQNIVSAKSAAAFEFQTIPDPLSSEAVGFAATFEFQNIPDPLSSEAIGFSAVAI